MLNHFEKGPRNFTQIRKKRLFFKKENQPKNMFFHTKIPV